MNLLKIMDLLLSVELIPH